MIDPERQTDLGNALVATSSAVEMAALAAVPVVGGPAAAFISELGLQRVERKLELLALALAEAAEATGQDIASLREEILGNPSLRGLMAAADAAASAAEDDRLLAMAGRLLKEGLVDHARVDEARLLLRTLRELEPAHLRLLGAIIHSRHPDDPDVYAPATRADLVELWPEGARVLPSTLATLEGGGLIRSTMFSPTQLLDPESKLNTDNKGGWARTSYGQLLYWFSDGQFDV